jgi:UDP-N-acetyl-D-mannosaminuronic acid dehydrogenase
MEEAGLSRWGRRRCAAGIWLRRKSRKRRDFIICVPTPVTNDKSVDLAAVRGQRLDRAVSALELLVILESTSPVGTTRNVVGPILKESGWSRARF